MLNFTNSLQWLETIYPINLPQFEKSDVSDISQLFIKEIDSYKLAFQKNLTLDIFEFRNTDRVKYVARLVNQTLIYHLKKINSLKEVESNREKGLVYEYLFSTLNELLIFTNEKFRDYLPRELTDHHNALGIEKNEFHLKKRKLISILKPVLNSDLYNLILSPFEDYDDNENHALNNKRNYLIMIANNVIDLVTKFKNHQIEKEVVKLLVYLNFNSSEFIAFIINGIKNDLMTLGLEEKKEAIYHHYYNFFQVSNTDESRLNEQLKDLETILEKWFLTQLDLINQQSSNLVKSQSTKKNPKIFCSLNIDQISLFFRAADECRVIEAKSLSAVFHAIIPYLSSINKENISPDSVRNKSYQAEEKDKIYITQLLNKMIAKINGY